jgi:hypothetical protein
MPNSFRDDQSSKQINDYPHSKVGQLKDLVRIEIFGPRTSQ